MFIMITTVILTACTTNPVGRRSMNFMSGSELNSMGKSSFEEMKQAGTVSQDPELQQYANCLKDAIVEVLPLKYQDYPWEIVVFEEDVINAFALPGGYMGIYTGLLKLAENEHQVAAVMGHEIGHVIAEHGGERLSSNMLMTGVLVVTDVALSSRSNENRMLIMAGLGVGAQLGVMLPFSRRHETEADLIGIDLMAKAGFDPNEAVRLWELMGEQSKGAPPELLSTHPSSKTRVKDLSKQIPNVDPIYQQRIRQGLPPQCPHPQFKSKQD